MFFLMKQFYLATCVAFSVYLLGMAWPDTVHAQTRPAAAPSVPATDNYFGTVVTDPYRDLENPQDPTVAAWMKAQSTYTCRICSA